MEDPFEKFCAVADSLDVKLKQMRDDTTAKLDKLVENNTVVKIKAGKGMSQLEKEIDKLNKDYEEAQAENEKHIVELNTVLRTAVDELQTKRNELRGKKVHRDHTVHKLKKEVAEKKQELLQKQKSQAKLDDIMSRIQKFEDVLGLKIEKLADGTLHFSFSNVDENEPSRPFSFMLKLEGNTYKITRCTPEVTDLNEVLEELNASNNVHRFVTVIRMRFKKLV